MMSNLTSSTMCNLPHTPCHNNSLKIQENRRPLSRPASPTMNAPETDRTTASIACTRSRLAICRGRVTGLPPTSRPDGAGLQVFALGPVRPYPRGPSPTALTPEALSVDFGSVATVACLSRHQSRSPSAATLPSTQGKYGFLFSDPGNSPPSGSESRKPCPGASTGSEPKGGRRSETSGSTTPGRRPPWRTRKDTRPNREAHP